ncbi:MAG: Uncharacterized protein JWM02_1925 [Frankiales bacterium]|nr:Uncharacterized protein [Frankiales bacterium]
MTLANAVVTAEQITAIAQDVWSSFLQLDLLPVENVPIEGSSVTGCVHVSGEWGGSIFLQCPAGHAQVAAEAMFAADPGSLAAEEISDALGELTNMIGGNIKSLLPAPSTLSIPSVATGDTYTVRVPGAVVIEHVALACGAGDLHISIWKV